MLTRRQILISALGTLTGGTLLQNASASSPKDELHQHGEQFSKTQSRADYLPVVTPNGSTLPYKIKNGVKEFHLIAEPIEREFAPGMKVKCWGYNGQTPGPTIEAVEGDRIRILVTNKLPEHTTGMAFFCPMEWTASADSPNLISARAKPMFTNLHCGSTAHSCIIRMPMKCCSWQWE